MVDVDAVILEELDRLAPPEDGSDADWTTVALRARRTPAQRRRRVRRWLGVGVPVVAVALLAPAFTFSSGVRSFLGFPHPEMVLSKASLLVSGPVGNGFFVHLWSGPSTSGGSCQFATLDHALAVAAHPTSVNGGGGCSEAHRSTFGETTAEHPLQVGIDIGSRRPDGNPANWVPPIVEGAVYPKLHATSVAVEWKGGSQSMALDENHFAGGGPRLYKPPFANLPYYVVAYDANGHEVARQKLETPVLYLTGWKQFTPKYLAWKKAHPGH